MLKRVNKIKRLIFTLLIIVAMAGVSQAKVDLVTLPSRDTVQLTIYNSADMTLVREARGLTLKEGDNKLQFSWENTLIDPTSLQMLPRAYADEIDITDLTYPPRVRNLGLWNIKSGISGKVPVEITFLTSGLSWRAFYMGTLSRDEKKMRLQAYVRVDNRSGENYENAQTRLIVGKVHILDEIAELARRRYPYQRPGEIIKHEKEGGEIKRPMITNGAVPTMDRLVRRARRKEIVKEGISEYFLYTIEGTETIPDKWGKRLLSFEKDDIDVDSLYKYDENRYGRQTIRFLSFVNDEEHNLGETPIPNGSVKIYGLADGQGHLSYVGGTDIKYIPVNEEVELNLGPARLVTVEPVMMNYRTDNYIFEKLGKEKKDEQIVAWDEIQTWKIKVTNTKKLPVEIQITRDFDTAYWSLVSDINYEKYDYRRVRYEITVPAESEKIFNYTVTKYHGKRRNKYEVER